jgi:hypothetical protein
MALISKRIPSPPGSTLPHRRIDAVQRVGRARNRTGAGAGPGGRHPRRCNHLSHAPRHPLRDLDAPRHLLALGERIARMPHAQERRTRPIFKGRPTPAGDTEGLCAGIVPKLDRMGLRGGDRPRVNCPG